MRFEQVPTEYASTDFTGADYGSRVRILMRSPEFVIFVALGVHLIPRGKIHYQSGRQLCPAAKRVQLSEPRVRELIIGRFGEGADDAAILAATTRGRGTMLVDGGGDKLPLPHGEQARLHSEAFEALTVSSDNLIPVSKLCLQCEKPLRPALDEHNFPSMPKEGQPKTVEDCQRLSNYPVFSVRSYGSNCPKEWWDIVSWFTTWDGESYEQDIFCSDSCAATYGRRAAQKLDHLPAGGVPDKPERHQTERTAHYDVEVDEKERRERIKKDFADQKARSAEWRKNNPPTKWTGLPT